MRGAVVGALWDHAKQQPDAEIRWSQGYGCSNTPPLGGAGMACWNCSQKVYRIVGDSSLKEFGGVWFGCPIIAEVPTQRTVKGLPYKHTKLPGAAAEQQADPLYDSAGINPRSSQARASSGARFAPKSGTM